MTPYPERKPAYQVKSTDDAKEKVGDNMVVACVGEIKDG